MGDITGSAASEEESGARSSSLRLLASRLGHALSIVLLMAVAITAAAQVNVPTSMYNNQRTSVNGNESILTPANVNTANFGKLFSQAVDGQVYAQPLYVSNVSIGGSPHNVVYVATQHDSVYAFDADTNTAGNAQPLWHTSFLSPGVTSVPSSATGCNDITPENGIIGTPVIDLATNTIYVVAETLENSGANFVKKLHALDIATGAEKPGSPVNITATVTVPGQSAVTFNTKYQANRPGLLLYNGVVYLGFGSHCDFSSYRGWILGYAYNGTGFSQVFVFSTEPSSMNGRQGGIWMGGQGLPMDSGSNLFVATGNGLFEPAVTPPINFGDSIIRIDLALGPTVQDYFTPSNQQSLDSADLDLGSGGMAILPDQGGPNAHLLVHKGKDGVIRVVNRDGMGQFNATSNNIVQEISGTASLFSSPVYFNGKVYTCATGDVARAFTVTNGMLSTSATDTGSVGFGFPGATPTISANGTSNAILWALRYTNGNAGILYAYDAGHLSAGALYRSDQNSARDNLGGSIKFTVPTVANGKVYVGTSAQLSVFGQLVPTAPALASAVSRKVHGSAGTFDLPLSLVATNPTTEPRQGPTQTIVLTFDKPIVSATAAVTEGVATAGTPIFSGNNVIVDLSGVTDQQYLTVSLANVASSDGTSGGSGSVRIGLLLGDVNQSRTVTVADLGLVNAQLAQPVTATNFLKDVNASGTLTVADKAITNADLTRALPAP
jgi:hypothetical protein